jgi:hypothetical protein
VRRNGVCYDVGREMLGQNWRPDFDPAAVRRELAIVHQDLHCNAVRLQGRSIERLDLAADAALREGLEVWYSPELWDHTPEEMLAYLARAAESAERLRRDHGDRVVVSVGSEVSLFSQGYVPGQNVLERLAHPRFREIMMSGQLNAPLNAFLGAACRTVRARFRGPLTYASVGFEQVDWAPFDFVGVDLYRDGRYFAQYPDLLRRYLAHGKPVANLEFGCCTFRGAEQLGGRGWEVVDFSTMPPRLKGDYVYDQATQAREVADLLRANLEAGVDATFVFTFIDSAGVDLGKLPLLAELEFDPDLPRYGLVKMFFDGRHGTTYPELPWEPKQSFRAVAEFYGRHPPRADHPASGEAP